MYARSERSCFRPNSSLKQSSAPLCRQVRSIPCTGRTTEGNRDSGESTKGHGACAQHTLLAFHDKRGREKKGGGINFKDTMLHAAPKRHPYTSCPRKGSQTTCENKPFTHNQSPSLPFLTWEVHSRGGQLLESEWVQGGCVNEWITSVWGSDFDYCITSHRPRAGLSCPCFPVIILFLLFSWGVCC